MCKKCLKANVDNVIQFPTDPTRTVGIRKRWIGQYTRRFRGLKGRINRLLLKGDDGGIPAPFINQLKTNAFEYTNDPESVSEFMFWLQQQINALLFTDDATAQTIWQNQYIDQAYLRGIRFSKAELKRLGAPPTFFPPEDLLNIQGTAMPVLGAGIGYSTIGSIINPIHLEAIQLLYIREFDALKGITAEMSKQISRILVDGVEQGYGVRKLAKLINDRVDKIGLTRSKLLARTETIRAYNIANINEYDSFAQIVDITPMFAWVTAGDGRVRPTHAARNTRTTGRTYTKAQILRLIGEPNCRCATRPHFSKEMLLAA